jgi:hypothetical protein
MSKETVEIERCICGGAHTYTLEVDRAILIKIVTMSDMSERPRSVKITRLFVCPVKKEQFQATFYLEDTSSSRIKDVRVVGLAGDICNE